MCCIQILHDSRVNGQNDVPGRWKSRIVAILSLFLALLFSWRTKGSSELPHRDIIYGLKINRVWISFLNGSNHPPWLRVSKYVIIFEMQDMSLTTLCGFKDHTGRWIFKFYMVKNYKQHRPIFVKMLSKLVICTSRLPESIQKNTSRSPDRLCLLPSWFVDDINWHPTAIQVWIKITVHYDLWGMSNQLCLPSGHAKLPLTQARVACFNLQGVQRIHVLLKLYFYRGIGKYLMIFFLAKNGKSPRNAKKKQTNKQKQKSNHNKYRDLNIVWMWCSSGSKKLYLPTAQIQLYQCSSLCDSLQQKVP